VTRIASDREGLIADGTGPQPPMAGRPHGRAALVNGLETGGVILNDSPILRLDHMPYGGVKESGLGREGVKYAMMDMLEPRILVK
jgi:acyl-CoA reductase-like NAD-dependent aldehyde dehydrogenase